MRGRLLYTSLFSMRTSLPQEGNSLSVKHCFKLLPTERRR
jgi:hypothetical protein